MAKQEREEDVFTLENFVEGLSKDQRVVLFHHLKDEYDPSIADRRKKLPELGNKDYQIFDDRKVKTVTENVLDIRKRRYMAFVHLHSHPFLTDDQVITYIMLANPEVSHSTAYRDCHVVKAAIGSMHKTSKELHRYQVIEMHKKAFQIAMEKNNEIGMVAAANGITRAANLEKEEPEQLPWDEILPPEWEPVHDIEAAGFERQPGIEQKIKKLIRKYDSEAEVVDE